MMDISVVGNYFAKIVHSYFSYYIHAEELIFEESLAFTSIPHMRTIFISLFR